ncbi:MAG: TetR/AcrR family transcriptional regulator [Tepidiformaceae bacterium]
MPPQMRTEALERGRESTRERILAAASDLFSRLGYEGTTVKDIARECQLTDPALYYYFDSKRDILAALLVEPPPVEDVHLESHVTPTREALIDDLCRIFDFWSGHAGTLRLIYGQALEGGEVTQTLGQQLAATYERLLMPPLGEIYGSAAERIYGVLRTLLTGVQLDALIVFGDRYGSGVATPEFEARLRRLVSEALPPSHLQPEAV